MRVDGEQEVQSVVIGLGCPKIEMSIKCQGEKQKEEEVVEEKYSFFLSLLLHKTKKVITCEFIFEAIFQHIFRHHYI